MARKTELPSLADQAWLQNFRLQQVMAALSQEGGEVRVVGGAVRNSFLGVAVADVDLATTQVPADVMRICADAKFGVHPTGLDHGTVTIVNDGAVFEVTTLRRDVATDGRRAIVEYSRDWALDAARRDFTMNALYCDSVGKCYDYTNGYDDILKRKLRFVGLASERIEEDFLRILRFFRFHAFYGVGAPDEDGLAACIAKMQGLQQLSPERIWQELIKLLVAPRAIDTLKLMADKNILKLILPHTDEWRVIRRLPADAILRLFVLAERPEEMQAVLRLSNAQHQRLLTIAGLPEVSPDLSEREQQVILYEIGADAYRDSAHLHLAYGRSKLDDLAWVKVLTLPDRWQVPIFPINGNDIKALGLAAGPRIGEIMREAQDWWLASDFKPGKEELLLRVRQNNGT